MADLNSLYHELGLAGLIPYALHSDSVGQKMLIEKIISGDPLFVLFSSLDAPFLVVKNNDYQALLFTDESLAQYKVSELLEKGYIVNLIPTPTDKDERSNFFYSLYCSGVSELYLNESLSLPITHFTEIPNYDGYLSNDYPLWNHQLNAAAYYYLQIQAAGYFNEESWKQFCSILEDSYFLILVKNDSEANFPLMTVSDGNQSCFLVYTDWLILSEESEANTFGCIFSFSNLKDLLQKNPNYKFLLNRPTCSYLVGVDTLKMVQNTNNGTLQFSQPKEQSSEEEDSDPMPDWLR